MASLGYLARRVINRCVGLKVFNFKSEIGYTRICFYNANGLTLDIIFTRNTSSEPANLQPFSNV